LALLVGATLFAAQPAAASPAAASPQTFAAQGAAAGLTAQQVSWLQTQVTSYVAKSGGRQTSLNTVDVNGRAELRIALPGEAHPRTFAGARPMSPAGPCDGGTAPGYLCLYQGQNGTGSQIPMYVCTTIDLPNWSGYGSWGDNQTTGTRSIFFTRYYGIGENIYAKANNQSYDWTPIWHVQNCGA
jgi:hypothetical protein